MNDAATLQQENEQLKALLNDKDSYIQQLEEAIKSFRRKQFGSSSEKVSADQIQLFNEAEAGTDDESADSAVSLTEPVVVKGHTRQKKPRITIPDNYPREEIVHDLCDAEKICPHDGATLNLIGSEDHEQLDVIPARIKVLRHRRLKYACPCCQGYLVTAAKPKQPIEKSIASPGLLAYIAVQKYCDALPLYRQTAMFKRLGIELDRTNLSNWMMKAGSLVQPLINLLQERILATPVVHLDETTVQVLNEPDKAAESKSYMWLMASFVNNQSAIVFQYAPTRSQSIPLAQLDESIQAIMVDGYEGYQKACDTYGIERLGCWAHARRKFVDAQKLQAKGKAGKSDQAIAFIQKLYRIEAAIKDDPPDKRYQLRQQQAKPILDKIDSWLQKSLPNVPPKTALGKALQYLHNQWPRLIRYVENGHYPIDNNPAENAIRPFAIGRKNWLFAQSQAGAKASANLYSLVETAKANGLNPYAYLKQVFEVLPNAETVEAIETLLPWKVNLK
ncbi:MAG: IS66 family transposase [Spongiibacteraceae bacterium]